MSFSSESLGIGFPFAISQGILGTVLGLSKTTLGFGHSLEAFTVIVRNSEKL